MTGSSLPAPRPAPDNARDAAPNPAVQLEAAAELPLEERAAQLVAIHQMLSSELRETEN